MYSKSLVDVGYSSNFLSIEHAVSLVDSSTWHVVHFRIATEISVSAYHYKFNLVPLGFFSSPATRGHFIKPKRHFWYFKFSYFAFETLFF